MATQKKTKDKLRLHVLMEGTLDGEPKRLEYEFETNDFDKFMDNVLGFLKEHKEELMKFYMRKKGSNEPRSEAI